MIKIIASGFLALSVPLAFAGTAIWPDSDLGKHVEYSGIVQEGKTDQFIIIHGTPIYFHLKRHTKIGQKLKIEGILRARKFRDACQEKTDCPIQTPPNQYYLENSRIAV